MLKELRRFGTNSGLSGQMTTRSKRGLNTPSPPCPADCIALIISMLKGSFEKTRRNKFLGDFSHFEAFISNTRDNWFQNRVSFPPTIRKGFFLPPPTHLLFRSLIPLGKQSSCLRGSQPRCSLWMQSEAIRLFAFPRNSSLSMKVSSGGKGKRLKYYSGCEGLLVELSSKESHLPLYSVKMEKRDFPFEASCFCDLLFGTTFWPNTVYTDWQEAAHRQSFREIWGPLWSTVSERAPNDSRLLVFGPYVIPSPWV